MAVAASAEQYAQWKKGARAGRTAGASRTQKVRDRAREAGAEGKSRLYASARSARAKAPTYARERARASVATAGRGAGQQYRKARGGFGAIFTVATIAGITIMVIRRPALITVPLGFITGIFRAFTTLAGKVTGGG